MNKMKYIVHTNIFYDAFFRLADWNKEEHSGNFLSVRVGNSDLWIMTHNSIQNWYYELFETHSDGSKKVLRRVNTSTKGPISSLLKAYLDYIEENEKGEN